MEKVVVFGVPRLIFVVLDFVFKTLITLRYNMSCIAREKGEFHKFSSGHVA